MSDVLKHRFVSPKLDGTDGTQVQPSAWNDGHKFIGGAQGDMLTRSTADANFGATWTTPRGPVAWVDRGATFMTAEAGGSWTVSAGMIATNAYVKDGATVTLSLNLNNTVIGGTPQYLIVRVDDVGSAARIHGMPYYYWSGEQTGCGYAETNNVELRLWRDIAGTRFVASSGFYVRLTTIYSLA